MAGSGGIWRENGHVYVLNRGIVCDMVPVLCMHVYIGMYNNVARGSFPFRRSEKPFSIFRAQKDRSFCEAATKIKLQNAIIPFF